MAKRTTGKYKRRKQDKYYTPYSAVLPLLPYLKKGDSFDEPCCGGGDLVRHLELNGMLCRWESDINPEPSLCAITLDALQYEKKSDSKYIITNPPWSRELLHPMIDHFRTQAPTWLLFDADWMHTVQAKPYLPYCHRIVSVGRVSWMGNGKGGYDNSAWYLFRKNKGQRRFYGRC